MQANYQGAPVYTGTSLWSSAGNSAGTGGQYACQAALSGTVTATLTWVPATGKTLATDPPSEPVCLLQTSYAAYSGGVGSGGINTGGTASDGLGDPCVNNKSQGSHLIQCDGSSGIITLGPVSLSASTAPYTPPPYGPNYAQAGAQYTVAVDLRMVTISADADPTHYKLLTGGVDANGDGNCTQAIRVRDSDGTMKGDIGIPYGQQHQDSDGLEVVSRTTRNVTYSGHLIGPWPTQNANYWWNSSLKNWSETGNLYYVPIVLAANGPPVETDIDKVKNVYVGAVVDSDTGAIVPNEAGPNGTTDHLFFKFQNGDNRPQ